MKHLLALLAVALACRAQSPVQGNFQQFTLVDECGGIPTFLGSNYILETSQSFCGASAISITSTATTPSAVTVTLGSTPQSYGIQPNDTIVPTGTGTCASGAFLVSSISGFTITTTAGCGMGTGSGTGGSLSGSYYNGSSPRYEMKLLSKTAGSAWGSASPSVSFLVASSILSDAACSIGNPEGYTDGTNFYVAFLAQHAALRGCGGTGASPAVGSGMDVWACNLGLGSAPNAANFTASNCKLLLASNTSNSGGMLDPHIHNGDVYVTERNNATVRAVVEGTNNYSVWSVDHIPITTWSPPTAGTSNFYVFDDAAWNLPAGSSRASNHCEEYYKLTGFLDLPGGTVRAFFQSNDIKTMIGGSLQNPYVYGGVATQRYAPGSGPCNALGAGIPGDSFAFSGIFYGDLTGASYNPYGGSTAINVGANYTQIYPFATPSTMPMMPPTVPQSCLTAKKNIRCYAEFPWVFKDGVHLLFEGGIYTSDAVVDQCAAVSAAPFCQPNYTDEWIQSQLFTDYSQTNYPTTMVAAAPLTNYNVSGTAACGQILWAQSGALTNCGIFASSAAFGGCGRMDVDEASGLAACADQDNRSEPATGGTSLYNRTMVIPFAGALFSPAVALSPGISASAGITVCSQAPCPAP